MFTETDHENDPRSSGAQCFRQWQKTDLISLRWSEERSFGARALYKRFRPYRTTKQKKLGEKTRS